jgi:hypothetical protein
MLAVGTKQEGERTMNEQTVKKTINGVDVRKLKDTIKSIGATPSLVDFRFRIANEWQGGGFNQSTVKASYGAGQEFQERDGKFTRQSDEPPILRRGDKKVTKESPKVIG